jgi:hypothetical protein
METRAEGSPQQCVHKLTQPILAQVPRMRPSEIMLDAHPLPSSRFSMV